MESGLSLKDLTNLNPTLAGIEYPELEIAEAYSRVSSTRYEADPFGSLAAREAVSAHYAARGIAIPPDRICLTASTSESFSLLMKILCDPGGSVLTPSPGYPLLEELAPLSGVRANPYPIAPDGTPLLEIASLEKAGLAVIVAPHMPLGVVPPRSGFEGALALAAGSGAVVALDEVFAEYSACPVGPLEFDAILVRLGGLSKTAGLPGAKIGWIGVETRGESGSSAAARLLGALERAADAFLSPSQPGMNALPRLLELAPRIRAGITARIAVNHRALLESPLAGRILSNGASWTAVIGIDDGRDDEESVRAMLERGWWIQPGYFYDIERPAVVLSLLPEPGDFTAGLRVLAGLLEER